VTHFQNFPAIRQALSSFAAEMKLAEDLDETYVREGNEFYSKLSLFTLSFLNEMF
jgi:hypothetical protein